MSAPIMRCAVCHHPLTAHLLESSDVAVCTVTDCRCLSYEKNPPCLRFCVKITAPGQDAVHLGYDSRLDAQDAARILNDHLETAAHWPGTAIAAIDSPPGVTLYAPLHLVGPRHDQTLIGRLTDMIRFSLQDTDPRTRYPDIYTRLCAQVTYSERDNWWREACEQAG